MKSIAADRLDLLAHAHALAAEDALGRVADDRRAGDVHARRRSAAEVAAAADAELAAPAPAARSRRCARSRGSRPGGWRAAVRRASGARRRRAASASAPSCRRPPGRRSSAPGRAAPRPPPRTCGRRRSAAGRRSGRGSGMAMPARRSARRAASRRPALHRPPVDFDLDHRRHRAPPSRLVQPITASKWHTSTHVPQAMHRSGMTWCGLLSVPTIASDGHFFTHTAQPLHLRRVDLVEEQFARTPSPGTGGRRRAPRTRRGTSAACSAPGSAPTGPGRRGSCPG